MNSRIDGKKIFTTREITSIGLMAALSIVLVTLVHFPIIPVAPWLEYDPADVPIFITAFAFGPLVGFVLTVVVSVIQGLTVSAASGVVGIIMHIAATGIFVIVAGNIYRRRKTRRQAVIALVSGVAVWTVTMIFWNILFTPLYTPMPREDVVALIVPAILPFNLIKAGVNSVATFLLYKVVGKLFGDRMGVVRKGQAADSAERE